MLCFSFLLCDVFRWVFSWLPHMFFSETRKKHLKAAQCVETEETAVTEYGGGAWFPKNRCPGATEMFKVIWLPLQSAVGLL